ncbi:DHH family phosphoesterase [Pseudalkalibacillus berkeleyi]|uniref:Cyclic-di-AMP phosphodiesterase n=1 Tax=Pseudalkalibacillus berkeleyi TaxID=1069813 RepID=A0ABS9H5N1_9BACL|nr:DHH family phosphoesterase [Pseudalkalibacillus berkeleyi]MCF6139100.1 DHH family phosphoesterase [Pseudalkalibacillus berkeleyi]
MPKYFEKRWQDLHIILLLVILAVFIGIITFYNWIVGIVAFVVLSATIYFALIKEIEFRSKIEDYISTLSHRVKKVGEEALMEMPIGIILYNDQYKIDWTNPYLTTIIEQESFIGNSLNLISEELIPFIKGEEKEEIIKVNKRKYRVYLKREERLLYFSDVTEQVETEQLYDEEQTVMGLIFLDNYDEVTQGMNDQVRSNINSKVTSILNQWANNYGIFLKRTSSERFVAVLNQRILSDLEKTKFALLDEVRDLTSKQNIPLTLSIGLGSGSAHLPDLGQLAQSSLDLALGRGGDQVAIKQTNGKVRFYGGKTNPMEKRTRVRARVISHALTELVLDSDQVIVMGHKNPDMDAIGASIGILKVASINDKPGSIVLDQNDVDIGIQRLLEEIKEEEELWDHFITPEEALERATPNTLLVVVDTHKPSLVIEEKLLNKLEKVIVIDHHRRGEEFINDPVLVYMEPYASSTAELVTELLEYQPKLRKMDILEATALLAGIIVDTKSFTLRTGSRTFDAASYLRSHGADTILVQKFLKEDIARYMKRSRLIENAAIYKGGIAIALGEEDEEYGQVLIAQAADTLLSMSGVLASFVISKRIDDKISISARSLGDVNVQLIMEKLNGGGHLTNAAAQLEDVTIAEAERRLKEILDEYFEGGDEE